MSPHKVDKGIKTVEEAKATKERVEKKGLTESAKTVAKESGKGAINGAAQGALTGKTIDLYPNEIKMQSLTPENYR